MRLFLQMVCLFIVPLMAFTQTAEEKQVITKDYNLDQLKDFAQLAKTKAEIEKNKALLLAKENGWFVRKDEGGVLSELMSVTEEGLPLYYVTENVNAAKSTRANTLHNGGILGLNVEGQNMEAHVWDGGLARSTHQEYDGIGGSNRFSIGDGTTSLHYHSAHVTGTIIASGFVAAAKGMAPQGKAVGYEWNNDVSEATTAASAGMLLSNHSYGYGASSLPDWYFGAYITESRDWDIVMNNAPYYLMVVSAGNDGNDNSSNGNPLDGNSSYDKLSAFKTSKNNMVVANAQDANIDANGNLVSVSINTSSSEGPTDEYRIKPDIAGNGTSLYSTYESADNAYNSISGTSMASPNVCGTLLLLQQYYNNLNAGFMRAATLKGLALHTADDAGSVGPDAVFGWGLLNGKEAATVILNNGSESTISEQTLSQGGTFSINVNSDGTNDLVASISWNDPAGSVNSGIANSTTPALVNDLDIRVTQTTSTYFPYKLTSITTNGTGDNVVDPFEKVIIPGASGTYTITVTHKGSLSGGSQDFSLIVSGEAGIPSLPIANFSADDLTPTLGQTVTLTDLSLKNPTSWEWTFSPSTITYVGGTDLYTQNPQVSFDAAGAYTVTLDATNALGSDTEIKTNYINVIDCTISSFPYLETFDSWSISVPAFSCTADGSVVLGTCWDNTSGDDIDWDVISGSTGSSNTGPTSDHTGTGKYLYTEASSCFSNTGSFTSPNFNFTSLIPQLRFWYHMYGTSMGTLSVQASTNNGLTWSANLWTISGNQGNAWLEAVIDLPTYASESNVIFRWTGNTGPDYTSDMAIDDVSILVQPDTELLWEGTTDSDWNNGNNWSGNNVPELSSNVTIPSSPSGLNFPETNTGPGANCNNLIIQTGGHLYIPANNTLTVNGTLINNSGNDGLILKSDASGTASLIHSSANVNAIVERYLTDGQWHFIGMPVSSALAGVFHLPSGHSDIFLRTHIESTNTWDNNIVPIGTPLVKGRGYEVWVGTPSGFTQPETIQFEGLLNAGNYTTGIEEFFPLAYTSGHGLNLISNPYPSALLANIGAWAKNNVDNSIWTWSEAAGNYVYWNGSNGTNGNGYGTLTGGVIPAMQGFFVLSNGVSPYMVLPQNDRIHSNQAYYKNVSSEVPNTLRLDISGNDYQDAVYVSFIPNATDEYDQLFDVKKLPGLAEAPQLFTLNSGIQLSIDAQNELDGYRLIQLGLECEANGNFSFVASDMESFLDYVPIFLEDTQEGVLQKLNDNPQYNFNFSSSDEIGRFLLHFGEPSGIVDRNDNGIKIHSSSNWIYIQSDETLHGEILVYDMLGQEISRTKANGNSLMKIQINRGTGYYLVKVKSSDRILTEKVFIK